MAEEHSGSQEQERSLLARVANKDRAAFEELYRLYHRRLSGYLMRMLTSREAVEEVLDDTLFVVWTEAARFRAESRVSTWIFGIAYRKALKELERRRRRREEVTAQPVAEAVGRRDREQGRRLLRASLERALAKLSPEHRSVVELTYFHDCSYQEIARIAGCPVNTVKTRMFHARQRLRKILPQLGWSSP